jgi:LacI family transcriptional regulator
MIRMTRRRATLRDVARRAGVHPSTVSRALNPRTREMITEKIARRVSQAAALLGYQANPIAYTLRTKRSQMAGVLIPDLTNPVFPPIIRGIEDALDAAGYIAIVANTDNDAGRERLVVQNMIARHVDGLILATARRRDALVDHCLAEEIPLVLVNRTVETGGVSSVVADDALGAQLIVDHLARLGHARIAHLAGPRNVSPSVQRHRGYLAALAEAGLPADQALSAESGFVEDGGLRAMEKFFDLPDPPTAVFAVTDLVAVGAYTAAARHGVRIPDQLAVVGYNDIPLASRISPAMTTVHLPLHEFGTVSTGILVDQIESGTITPRRVLFSPQLVVRDSTQPGGAGEARSVSGEKAHD